ncbi:hypothetical protein [Edaphocola flava]|uniref:hypothetical protein n=1 Tax=Edaphocola flava TaxID=2499629 RepID=UPI00100BBF5E|nr:hypothetical protein [Edaphocola flava]
MKKIFFVADEDTALAIRIISRYLKKYLNYNTIEDIINAINNYYSKMQSDSNESGNDFFDLYFHHDHPFLVACRIHYHNNQTLQDQYSDLLKWLRDINWFNVPDNAQTDYQIWFDEESKK